MSGTPPGGRGRTGSRPLQAGPVAASHVQVWLALVVGSIVVGTIGFIVIEGWDVWTAFYMTGITLTTVGFREAGPLGTAGQVWTVIVAFVGVGLIFGFVGVVAEYFVAETTSGKREAQRMARSVEALQGHFVLCGYGRVGTTVARELAHDGESVVVIDVLPESLERAKADGHFIVEGDATQDATLQRAGIARAHGLVTTVDSDAANVYVILSARAVNPGLFVVARANAAGAEARLQQAGANRVVSPYTMAGHRIASLALRPRVVDFIDAALSHGELSFSLEEVTVASGGPLDGRTVGELRDRGIFTLAVVRPDGGYEANPDEERRLRGGEEIIVSGSASTLKPLRDEG